MAALNNVELKQFVVFNLGKNEYALDIQKVTIIEKMMGITRVPQTPFFIKGVVNLRGTIIPVMDLRQKFGISVNEETEETRIVIFKVENISMGIIVDAVSEVLKLDTGNIENIQNITNDISLNYISGVGKIGERIITILNAEKLIRFTEDQ